MTRPDIRWAFAGTLATHLVAVILTTITELNPNANGDAIVFRQVATGFAETLLRGSVPAVNLSATHDSWGILLAPLWVIPGPSLMYARVSSAFFGAFAAYNIYIIARSYESRQAGVFAALPLAIYPSILSTHATILREAIILFGMTTIAQVYLLDRFDSSIKRHVITVMLLSPTILLRNDNLPVYVVVFAVAATVSLANRYNIWASVSHGIAVLSLPVLILTHPKIREVLGYLSRLRDDRATGRTKYLPTVLPETVPTAVAFGWVGAAYFLYSPFPWMIQAPIDLLIAVEGLVNLVYTAAALHGVRLFWRRSKAGTVALVVGCVLGAVLYGLGTANVGTAVRHRQMVLWVIFLLGGVGISDHLSLDI